MCGLLAGRYLNVFPTTRRQVVWFGVLWTLTATAEFWIAGPWTFILLSQELNYSLPLYQYFNQWHDGGTFSHAYAGGNDAWAMSAISGQYVSLERLLLQAFPLWLANGIHKVLVTGLGFVGIYRIGRYFPGSTRAFSSVLAALYTLSFVLIVNVTWLAGVGYALIPLAVYGIVFRANKTRYFASVSCIAALNAISCMPTHSVLTLVFAVAVASLLINTERAPRIATGLCVILGFVLLNWHEAVYGWSVLAPFSYRFQVGADPMQPVAEVIAGFLGGVGPNGYLGVTVVIGAALFLLATMRKRFFWRALAVSLLAILFGPMMVLAPWQDLGLKLLGGINFQYLHDALPVTAAILLARAFAWFNEGRTEPPFRAAWFRPQTVSLLVFAAAVAQMGWYKVYHAAVWLSEGSIGLLAKAEQRLDLDWVPAEPMRVISVPYRFATGFAPAIGLHSFDGGINLVLLSKAIYWGLGVTDTNGALEIKDVGRSGFVSLRTSGMDFKCCRIYDITKHMDLDLLRVANVGYILSVLPLEGGGIRQVAGPEGAEDVPPRRSVPLLRRLQGYARLIARPSRVRVYEIASYLPRAFAARGWISVSDEIRAREFLRLVAKHGVRRKVVVSDRFAHRIAGTDPMAEIRRYDLVRDGIDIEVDSPGMGLVVVNIPYTPFWKVVIDGDRRMDPFPVNLIQMAVEVPAGTTHVAFRYERELLRDRIGRWLTSLTS